MYSSEFSIRYQGPCLIYDTFTLNGDLNVVTANNHNNLQNNSAHNSTNNLANSPNNTSVQTLAWYSPIPLTRGGGNGGRALTAGGSSHLDRSEREGEGERESGDGVMRASWLGELSLVSGLISPSTSGDDNPNDPLRSPVADDAGVELIRGCGWAENVIRLPLPTQVAGKQNIQNLSNNKAGNDKNQNSNYLYNLKQLCVTKGHLNNGICYLGTAQIPIPHSSSRSPIPNNPKISVLNFLNFGKCLNYQHESEGSENERVGVKEEGSENKQQYGLAKFSDPIGGGVRDRRIMIQPLKSFHPYILYQNLLSGQYSRVNRPNHSHNP